MNEKARLQKQEELMAVAKFLDTLKSISNFSENVWEELDTSFTAYVIFEWANFLNENI